MSIKEKRRSQGEKRREEKQMDIDVFLHTGKKKKKGALFVLKLGIPDFLLGCFNNG